MSSNYHDEKQPLAPEGFAQLPRSMQDLNGHPGNHHGLPPPHHSPRSRAQRWIKSVLLLFLAGVALWWAGTGTGVSLLILALLALALGLIQIFLAPRPRPSHHLHPACSPMQILPSLSRSHNGDRHGHGPPHRRPPHFPFFPPPPPGHHHDGQGPRPPPPPPPHHPAKPLQCWTLPEGETVNISLPLPPPPPPPHHRGPGGRPPHSPSRGGKDGQSRSAGCKDGDAQRPQPSLASIWSRVFGPKHGHPGRRPPPPPPTIWLHQSLLSSDVTVVRDDKENPSLPFPPPDHHKEPAHDDTVDDDRHDGHDDKKPKHPTILASFTREAASKDLKTGDGDDGKKQQRIDVCTFPAPGGVTVGLFLPPPWVVNGTEPPSDGPPALKGDGQDGEKPPRFPHHPLDQFPRISATIHLPAGAPIKVDTVPPPPPPRPHHGRPHHREGDK